jgi:hypothetical protein
MKSTPFTASREQENRGSAEGVHHPLLSLELLHLSTISELHRSSLSSGDRGHVPAAGIEFLQTGVELASPFRTCSRPLSLLGFSLNWA